MKGFLGVFEKDRSLICCGDYGAAPVQVMYLIGGNRTGCRERGNEFRFVGVSCLIAIRGGSVTLGLYLSGSFIFRIFHPEGWRWEAKAQRVILEGPLENKCCSKLKDSVRD